VMPLVGAMHFPRSRAKELQAGKLREVQKSTLGQKSRLELVQPMNGDLSMR
jgi:hypothetical protein